MNSYPDKSLSLIELIIAIVLMGLIVLGFASIDLFSRHHVITSDRRAKAQNEASQALEHMTKEIGKAIGDIDNSPISTTPIAGDTAIRAYVDLAADGVSAGDGQRGTGGDRWRAYRYRDAGAPADDRYQIWYYPNYVNPSSSHEVIARSINPAFGSAYDPNLDYVEIRLTACYDADETHDACATRENPSVTMHTRIKMPAVSTR